MVLERALTCHLGDGVLGWTVGGPSEARPVVW
jgi:hypothetical protein